ncbi:6886_t:CDS:2 [Dentiscutata heterogama]|uniref:6886_t:CDS:1 n=1 Tax=Dentiscutata heterogama TaxID=1316150 RepID=A0ACA9K0R4_9GLOM|nr:6886_t:CDS:2 [Dentiscutata heterogama]
MNSSQDILANIILNRESELEVEKPEHQVNNSLGIEETKHQVNNLLEELEHQHNNSLKIEESEYQANNSFINFLDEIKEDYKQGNPQLCIAFNKFSERYKAAKSLSILWLTTFFYNINYTSIL